MSGRGSLLYPPNIYTFIYTGYPSYVNNICLDAQKYALIIVYILYIETLDADGIYEIRLYAKCSIRIVLQAYPLLQDKAEISCS